jgi:protoporphyrinogen oxidase
MGDFQNQLSAFDRRQMLAALLGMPALLSGCRDTSKPPLFEGRIVGQSQELGHRLWKKDRPSPAEDAWERCSVLIVGGGIAGLSAAWRLQKAGCCDFTVIEMEPRPGGTSVNGTSEISAFPWAAHYVPVPMKENATLVSLLDEMGVLEGRDAEGEPIVSEQFLCRDPQERLFYKGRWYEGLYLYAGATADDLAQFHAFQSEMDRWAAWRDGRGRRAFALPIAVGSDDAEVTSLDKISMSQWLDRYGWTSPRLRWLVDYCCRDDYGTKCDQTSAWAGVFYFASRIRRPGMKSQPLITWPEGNGRFVSHLYEAIKPRVRLGWLVAEIIPREGSVDVVMLDAAGENVRGLRADQVIFAAPQFIAKNVIRDYRRAPPKHIDEFQYAPWMVANLSLRDRPGGLGFPLAWDNVLYESPSLGYVVATHQTGVDFGPTVLTYYYAFASEAPVDARQKLFNMNWNDCAMLALTDLQRVHPELGRLVQRLDIMRWGHAMVRPTPNFIWSDARRNAAKAFRGIHFANTDLSGVALLEEALYHGVRAAEEVLAARRAEFRTMLSEAAS